MLVSASSLIKESWKIYKDNFSLFFKIIAWFFIPAAVWAVLGILNLNEIFIIPISILVGIAYFILALFLSIALIVATDSIINKKKVDLSLIYKLSYSKIISYLWVSVLFNLAILAGLILLVIPGIILAVLLSFSAFAVILDNKTGSSALSESKKLVKDNFWGVLWRWVATYFVYGFILSIIVFVLTYLVGLVSGELSTLWMGITPWWATLISDVLSILTIPIFTTIGVLMYNDIKKEKTT